MPEPISSGSVKTAIEWRGENVCQLFRYSAVVCGFFFPFLLLGVDVAIGSAGGWMASTVVAAVSSVVAA
jgi:hypothetical protein